MAGEVKQVKPAGEIQEITTSKGPKWRFAVSMTEDNKTVTVTLDTFAPECREAVAAAIEAGTSLDLYITPSSDPKWPPMAGLPRQKGQRGGAGPRGRSPEERAQDARAAALAQAVAVTRELPGFSAYKAEELDALILDRAARYAQFIMGPGATAPAAEPQPKLPPPVQRPQQPAASTAPAGDPQLERLSREAEEQRTQGRSPARTYTPQELLNLGRTHGENVTEMARHMFPNYTNLSQLSDDQRRMLAGAIEKAAAERLAS